MERRQKGRDGQQKEGKNEEMEARIEGRNEERKEEGRKE